MDAWNVMLQEFKGLVGNVILPVQTLTDNYKVAYMSASQIVIKGSILA